MISLNTAIYALFTLALLVWFLVDLFNVSPGSWFVSGKKKGEMGFTSLFIIVVWIIFTLIWGGICWW
jgi:predicted small integral membrane protein